MAALTLRSLVRTGCRGQELSGPGRLLGAKVLFQKLFFRRESFRRKEKISGSGRRPGPGGV
jgi:hypothetical protein